MKFSDLNPKKIKKRVASTFNRGWGEIASDNIKALHKYAHTYRNTKRFCMLLRKKSNNTYKQSKLYIAFYENSDFTELVNGVKHYKFGVIINGECLGKDVDIADKFGPFITWCKDHGKEIFKANNFNFKLMKEACKQSDLEYVGLFFVTKNNNKVYLIQNS